jgi:hypothetical protein
VIAPQRVLSTAELKESRKTAKPSKLLQFTHFYAYSTIEVSFLGLNSAPRLSILAGLRFLLGIPSIELEDPDYDRFNTSAWWFD